MERHTADDNIQWRNKQKSISTIGETISDDDDDDDDGKSYMVINVKPNRNSLIKIQIRLFFALWYVDKF